MSKEYPTVSEAIQKLENYCAYQERCHEEVVQKLRTLKMTSDEIDRIVVHLITDNFLNEERFACSFARGKHRIKHWGKIRIVRELQLRHISKYNIDKALKEIDSSEYLENFHILAEKNWDSIAETNLLRKKKKWCDFLFRKGFESQLVYEKLQDLSSKTE
ncbi:regulatory protein RecX [uncultured Flavobacterium sp.]|uniref:regulatory protein RecX n=1 Tax=uncultured Flavobacterium sp. TaxID=165435 RepID=UPI0025CCCC53|nr:regulatory protein RecX [uncultured Flavobacterium sp.]